MQNLKRNTIVIIDAGGRGSVLVHKYSKSPSVGKIIAIPGNDLMQLNADKPVEIHKNLKTTSLAEILHICQKEHAALIDVAQDNAVAVGLVDTLLENGFLVVGPTKAAGEIEWSKAFARTFMDRLNIPQPSFSIFHTPQEGIAYLNRQPDQPWFVKASGLAEGKGALAARNNKEAISAITKLQKFGKASETYLLEKWLRSKDGTNAEEFSAFGASDGKNFRMIGYAQDHKRALDGDKGENTGGMGCSTPPLVITKKIQQQVETIFTQTIHGLAQEGRPYKGILYLGAILVASTVYVIEFNARWGDPEAEVLLPSLSVDLFTLSSAIAQGNIEKQNIILDGKARVTIAATSKGYPNDYSQVIGKEIHGLVKASKMLGVVIYGAGVKVDKGKHYANGGRLFFVVGEGKDVIEARKKAYSAMKKISIDGDNLHYRKDIGWKDVFRMKKHLGQ